MHARLVNADRPLPYSVVIPTKDRPREVVEALGRVLQQTRVSARTVVVDASSPPWRPDETLEARFADAGVELVVLHAQPSTAGQRNRGVDLVETPVTLFLDDDVEIGADYAAGLLARWDEHGVDALGGVAGSRVGYTQRRRQWLARKLFMLHLHETGGEATTIRRSGKLRYVDRPARDVFVPAVGAGAISFRTELVQSLRFDERFGGYALGEDLDLARRVSATAPILQAYDVLYRDLAAPGGRSSPERWYYRGRRETYFRLRHSDGSRGFALAFALSLAGELLAATLDGIRTHDPRHPARFVRGVAQTLRERRRGSAG